MEITRTVIKFMFDEVIHTQQTSRENFKTSKLYFVIYIDLSHDYHIWVLL